MAAVDARPTSRASPLDGIRQDRGGKAHGVAAPGPRRFERAGGRVAMTRTSLRVAKDRFR